MCEDGASGPALSQVEFHDLSWLVLFWTSITSRGQVWYQGVRPLQQQPDIIAQRASVMLQAALVLVGCRPWLWSSIMALVGARLGVWAYLNTRKMFVGMENIFYAFPQYLLNNISTVDLGQILSLCSISGVKALKTQIDLRQTMTWVPSSADIVEVYRKSVK